MDKEEIEIDHTKDSFCVRIPLITEQEFKRIDDNLNSITDELTKQIIHDKELGIAQCIIQKQKEKIDQLETEKQKLIETLEKANEEDTKWVKYYERVRRNTTSEYYKKSYQTSIHKLNAKRETRRNILKIMKGED